MRGSLSAITAASLVLSAHAGSVPPEPRLARSLSAERAAVSALKVRHNEALKALFAETGIPTGSDAASVALRTRAVELINAAITNGVELADGSGVTADAVAWATGDFVGRYVTGSTNAVMTKRTLSTNANRQTERKQP